MNHSDIFPSRTHKKHLLDTLKQLNIKYVLVEFEGSGDSGYISDIYEQLVNESELASYERRRAHGSPLTKNSMFWTVEKGSFEGERWVRRKEEAAMSLHEIFEKMAYAALETTGLDWYNNDGGQGKIEFELVDGDVKIEMQVEINETITHPHSFSAGNNMERSRLP